MAELFGPTQIAVARLGSGIHFSRTWAFGERSYPSDIFLCDRVCRPLADEKMAASDPPGASRRASDHARDLRGVGDSLLTQYDDARGGSQVVESVHRPAPRHRF